MIVTGQFSAACSTISRRTGFPTSLLRLGAVAGAAELGMQIGLRSGPKADCIPSSQDRVPKLKCRPINVARRQDLNA